MMDVGVMWTGIYMGPFPDRKHFLRESWIFKIFGVFIWIIWKGGGIYDLHILKYTIHKQ